MGKKEEETQRLGYGEAENSVYKNKTGSLMESYQLTRSINYGAEVGLDGYC